MIKEPLFKDNPLPKRKKIHKKYKFNLKRLLIGIKKQKEGVK